MTEQSMHRIEDFAWLCEDCLKAASAAAARGDHAEATEARDCAEMWSDWAFQEAQA